MRRLFMKSDVTAWAASGARATQDVVEYRPKLPGLPGVLVDLPVASLLVLVLMMHLSDVSDPR